MHAQPQRAGERGGGYDAIMAILRSLRAPQKDFFGCGRGSSCPVCQTTRAGEVRKRGYAAKEPVTLIDGKRARSFHVPEVNSATLKPILKAQIDAASWLMTDDATYYRPIGGEFRRHFTVNHSIGEYVSGGSTVNARENYFSILKRGINGVYQHVSPAHLKRYVAEFDFRYNNRIGLGINDMERTEKLACGAVGERLTYQRTRQQPEAEASA